MNNKLNTALIVITYITSGILIILNGLAIYNYIYLLEIKLIKVSYFVFIIVLTIIYMILLFIIAVVFDKMLTLENKVKYDNDIAINKLKDLKFDIESVKADIRKIKKS